MQNFKKTFLASALIIVSIFAQSQSISTYSPYSRYGIGQIPTRGFAGTKGMGGVSQAVRNAYGINYLNPASYSAQDTMSFILDFGFETGATTYETKDQSVKNGFGGIHHIAFSFPVTKWWGASFGLVPYSQVGYQVRQYETNELILSTIGRVKYYHRGSGGINQGFGNGFKPMKNLSVGFNISYFFGSLDYTNRVIYPYNKPNYLNTNEKNSIVVGDVALSIGAQYVAYIDKKENTFLTFGATIDNKTNIRAKRKYYLRYEDLNSIVDTISYIDGDYGQISFPRNVSVGVAYTMGNKLFTSVEYSTQDWTNTTFLGGKQPLTKSNTYRFGVEYTPNRFDLKNYFKKMSYRFGSHYTNTYLNLNDHQINEFALSAGIGLPFRNNTKFNVAYEWGKRGTTNYGLIKESYGIFSLSFTFYDFWFFKRKYN